MEQKFPKGYGWKVQILNSQKPNKQTNPQQRVEKSEKLTSHSIPLEGYH